MKGLHNLLRLVVIASLLALAWSTSADDKDASIALPVVEATVPETLHPNDVALTLADRALTARVRATLVAAPFLQIEAETIAVQTRDGEVTLRGSIRSRALKEEVDARVPLIPGVKALDNKLTIKSEVESSH